MIAPTLGLKPTAPQKLAGRRIEPTTWVPSPAGTMPAPTAAAEPLDEPPGVRVGSCGFWVLCNGWLAANSVVVVLPRMMAPASRSAWTLAESRRDSWPSHIGEPWPVGMSAVSMMSLIAIGMPSIGDSGLPARQRSVEASAALIAPSLFKVTKAPMRRSSSAMRLRRFVEIGARRDLAGAKIDRQRDIAAELAAAHGRTAGVSTFMPRARHIRNSSRSTYSAAP